jgi:tetratricopeptide (TPR) repeat protein
MRNEPSPEGSGGPIRRSIVGPVAIVLWVLLVAVLLGQWWLSKRPPATATAPAPATGTAAHRSEEALAALVAERIAELNIKPRTAVVPSDRALDTAVAIKQGDYAHAGQIAADVLAHSSQQAWRFYPFNDFMGSIARGDDPQLLEHLNVWVKQEPKSAIPYLIRSTYYEHAAWAARGTEVASRVPGHSMSVFVEDLARAGADLQESIALNPRIPWSYFALLDNVASEGESDEVERAFQAGIEAFPTYYPLYQRRLRSLAPKWGGSIEALYGFIDRYVAREPDNSPLELLYLDLYAIVLDAAAFDCGSLKNERRQECIKAVVQRTVRPGLADGMAKALNLYKVSDPVQFSTALWPLLEKMACNRCFGSPAAVGGVLQMAASVMGSDNQLMDEPGHNSYVLDDITARVWAQMGNSANADKKFREALQDVAKASFPDEAQRAGAAAAIFEHMVQVADDNSQFVDMIVYHDAANIVGGNNHGDSPWLKCYAYYRMKHFAEALKECTALIEGNGNYLLTHYWRGKAYEGLGQWDASIADFSPVADSADNYFRVGAALDMSYDFGQKGDFAGQLTSMNQHSYLFDSNIQPPDDLAVSYNNRCFAYMKLGQLQKALDDCTMSLKYGRIPDAFTKQQELLKRLGVKTSA